MTAGRDGFDRLFIAWRFGDPEAGVQALEAGLALVEADATDPVLLLRMGILLWDSDRAAAEGWIDRARQGGVDIPRAYSRPDETRAPVADADPAFPDALDIVVVSPPCERRLPAPAGTGEHPAFSHELTMLPALRCLSLPRGSVAIDTTPGRPGVHVRDASGRLVEAWSSGALTLEDSVARVAGPLVLVDDAFSTFNVCHTLFDKLPRLAVYERLLPGQPLTALMYRDHPYHRDALAWLGHDMVAPGPGGRGVFSGDTTHLLSNHHRGEVRHPGFRAAPWAVEFIRSRFQAATAGTRRLFISRRDATVPRLVEAEAVEEVFVKRGFEVVTLTGRTFAEQRDLFRSAGIIAGAHGAGLANLVFTAPGSRVYEIMPPLAGTRAFGIMARALGLDYAMFVAEDVEFPVGPGARYDPMLSSRTIRADPVRLAADLDRFLGSGSGPG